jgi:hypothetical protein
MCTLFAAVVTVAEAWQERAQSRWPEVTAYIDSCRMDRTSTGRRNGYYIDCRLSYFVGDAQQAASIYSRTVPGPDVWQYPRNQIGPLQDWMEAHPPGTPISVRYDPADHAKVVLVATDMPGVGPMRGSNIRQIEFWGGSFLVLLVNVGARKKRAVAKASVNNSKLSPAPHCSDRRAHAKLRGGREVN